MKQHRGDHDDRLVHRQKARYRFRFSPRGATGFGDQSGKTTLKELLRLVRRRSSVDLAVDGLPLSIDHDTDVVTVLTVHVIAQIGGRPVLTEGNIQMAYGIIAPAEVPDDRADPSKLILKDGLSRLDRMLRCDFVLLDSAIPNETTQHAMEQPTNAKTCKSILSLMAKRTRSLQTDPLSLSGVWEVVQKNLPFRLNLAQNLN